MVGIEYGAGFLWCERIYAICAEADYYAARVKERRTTTHNVKGGGTIDITFPCDWQIRNEWKGNVGYPMKVMVWC